MQLDRRGEVPQQGGNRFDRHLIEFEGLLRFQHIKHVADGLTLILQRNDGTLLVIELDVEGDMQRQLLRLILGRWGVLAHMEAIDTAGGIVLVSDGQLRRAGLAVPAAETAEIDTGSIFHRLHEIIAGSGRAVVTLEVETHTGLEGIFPQQGVHHADHFRPLLVDGQGVEVVHLDHHIRADRVRHGAGIFGKLRAAHGTHVVDAIDATGAQIRGELLIPEHRQPLFEAELEPVATGDAVAGPIVEIFVTDHPFDTVVVAIGGGGRIGQHELGVEDVEPLVLHGAHVEEVHRHDHVDVEIILEAETLLVPAHGVDEALHGKTGAVEVALIDEDLEGHPAAAFGGVVATLHIEITGDQRKQVARFGERILPLYEMTTTIELTTVNLVAVGEQEGELSFVGGNAGAVARQNIWAVQIIGDAAKPFRFTLGAVGIARLVKPFQRGVGGRIQQGDDGQHTFGRQVEQGQTALALLVVVTGNAINGNAFQGQLLTIEYQRRIVLAVATNAGDGGDLGQRLLQLEIEVEGVDPVERRLIILAIFGRHGLGVIGHYCLLPRLLKARKRLSQPTGGVKQFAYRQICQTKRKSDRSRPCSLC